MNLCINQLFQWNNEGARIERILWIEDAGQRLVTIDVTDKQAWPSFIERSFLERHITDGSIHLLDSDMYEYLRQPDNALTLSDIEQRERAWRVIADIVASQQEETGIPGNGAIFQSPTLDLLVQAAVERTGCSKQWICTCLRRYWQRGQMKNALLPEFDCIGAQGKEQKGPERHASKRGRPSYISKLTGDSTGVNIDDTIKEYFRRGTKLFYENIEGIPMTQAFERILTLFFHQGTELRNGVFVPLLPPVAELPTFNQYRYWYTKEHDLGRSLPACEDLQAFEIGGEASLEHLQMIPGPGYLFEIHVVVGDIFLVSMLDRRRILGRPIIYIIVDVISDLIVGMSVSLEGLSWEGAMLALENATLDKGAFCKEYGIDINEDDWPSHHLPKAILSNRSELLLKNADILVNALGIEITNTKPSQFDWKKSFERCFPLLDDMTIDQVPGSAKSLSEPGRKGHRLDGCLTFNEFRRLVIKCVIEHNIAHRLSNDDLDGEMVATGVEPYPRDLWKWGIQNRSGMLHKLPIDVVRRNLLPEAEALVTGEEIFFRGLQYTSDRAIQERWFEQGYSGMKGRLTIPILYDPRTPDRIYLRPQENQPLVICRLLEKDMAQFEKCDWFDIEDMMARHMSKRAAITQIHQLQREHRAMGDRIIEETLRRMSKVRENRAAEKVQQREKNTWEFQQKDSSGTEQSHPIFKGMVERTFALDNEALSISTLHDQEVEDN